MLTRHKLPDHYSCPKCKHKLDGATSMSENSEPPKPGDVTLCKYCFVRLKFAEDGIELLGDDEFMGLPVEVRNELAQAMMFLIAMEKARHGVTPQ